MTSRDVSLVSRGTRDPNLFTRSKFNNPPQLILIITTEGYFSSLIDELLQYEAEAQLTYQGPMQMNAISFAPDGHTLAVRSE
jgi:hypothetical protein